MLYKCPKFLIPLYGLGFLPPRVTYSCPPEPERLRLRYTARYTSALEESCFLHPRRTLSTTLYKPICLRPRGILFFRPSPHGFDYSIQAFRQRTPHQRQTARAMEHGSGACCILLFYIRPEALILMEEILYGSGISYPLMAAMRLLACRTASSTLPISFASPI